MNCNLGYRNLKVKLFLTIWNLERRLGSYFQNKEIRMKHLIKIFSISLIALLAIVNCRHHSLADRADWIAKRVASELDLNDKQKAELQRIKKEILDKRKELDVKMFPDEIVDQIRQAQIDEAKVNKAFETSGTKRDQMRVFMTKKFIEFHAVLTPEQRNKLADKVTELLKKHSHD